MVKPLEFTAKKLMECQKERIKQAAADQLVNITERVQQQGHDARDKPFPDYSPAYLRKRRKEGLTDFVNLTFTGDMLKNLNVLETTPRKFVIGFTSDREHKKAQNVTRLKGKWLGMTDEEEKNLAQDFRKDFARCNLKINKKTIIKK